MISPALPYAEVIVGVVVGFARAGDEHNHRHLVLFASACPCPVPAPLACSGYSVHGIGKIFHPGSASGGTATVFLAWA